MSCVPTVKLKSFHKCPERDQKYVAFVLSVRLADIAFFEFPLGYKVTCLTVTLTWQCISN